MASVAVTQSDSTFRRISWPSKHLRYPDYECRERAEQSLYKQSQTQGYAGSEKSTGRSYVPIQLSTKAVSLQQRSTKTRKLSLPLKKSIKEEDYLYPDPLSVNFTNSPFDKRVEEIKKHTESTKKLEQSQKRILTRSNTLPSSLSLPSRSASLDEPVSSSSLDVLSGGKKPKAESPVKKSYPIKQRDIFPLISKEDSECELELLQDIPSRKVNNDRGFTVKDELLDVKGDTNGYLEECKSVFSKADDSTSTPSEQGSCSKTPSEVKLDLPVVEPASMLKDHFTASKAIKSPASTPRTDAIKKSIFDASDSLIISSFKYQTPLQLQRSSSTKSHRPHDQLINYRYCTKPKKITPGRPFSAKS